MNDPQLLEVVIIWSSFLTLAVILLASVWYLEKHD